MITKPSPKPKPPYGGAVFAGLFTSPQKEKSVFSCLVVDDPQGLSEKDFDAKLKAYREARSTRNGGRN